MKGWRIEYHSKSMNEVLFYHGKDGDRILWRRAPNLIYLFPKRKEAEAKRQKLLARYKHIPAINRRIVIRRNQ